MAWAELKDNADYRQQSTNFENKQDFLNSAPGARSANKYKSPWKRARQASEHLKIKWKINEQLQVSLQMGDETVEDRRKIFRSIRSHLRKKCTISLRNHPNQGKINACIAASSASSHFFHDGAYTAFKDWMFSHRARLELTTQLNACNFADRTRDRRCRKCANDQTLLHVLEHCMVHSTLYKKRHDAVVSRVKKAAMNRWEVMTENQVIGSFDLRPDLVLKKKRCINIRCDCPL